MNPQIQPMNTNVLDTSKLKDYQKCPRYFFYRHLLGWESDVPSNHLVFGSAWHKAMEHLLLHGYSAMEVVRAHEAFLEYYRREFPPSTDDLFAPKTPDNALLVLAKYTSKWTEDQDRYKTIYTEIAGKVMIDDRHSMAFRMDSILEDTKLGRIISREHKTGSRTWLWDEQWLLDMQPGTYSHVLYCLYPYEQVDRIEMNGSFFIKRKNDPYDFRRFDVRKTKAQMNIWLNSVQYLFWEIEREYDILNDCSEGDGILKAFPLKDSGCLSYGKVCDFQDYCLSWPNPLQRCEEPPIGFHKRYWNPLEEEAKHTFEFDKKEY